jgi:hypothetical protein
MIASHHIRSVARPVACALAVLAVAAPVAQAAGPQFVTEHSATQNRVDLRNAYGAPDPWQQRFITENSASQNRVQPTGGVAFGPAGLRFITENSASQNQLASAQPSVGTPVASPGFDWTALVIGAAGSLALIALTAIAALAVRRTRRHVAPAG